MKTYFDIEGDGGSNVVGQVEALEESIRRSLGGVRRLVAIGSGKGGVGKSTVTMGLAQALRATGAEVAILDADFNGPCQAHLAGLTANPWLPGPEGIALPRRRDGVGVVSMGSVVPQQRPVTFDTVSRRDEHVWRSTREFALLGQLLASMDWGALDFLLFDLPPGAERTVQYAEFLPESVGYVLVTVPSDVSRGVVARSVAALGGTGARVLGYVENMAGYYCRDCGEIKPLFPESRTPIDLPLLGQIPFDPEMAELCDEGWPERRDRASKAVEAVEDVGRRLLETLEGRT